MVAHAAGRLLYGWEPAPPDDRRDSRFVGVVQGPCCGPCSHLRCRWRRARLVVEEIDRQRQAKHSPPAAAAVPVGGEPNRSVREVADGSCSTRLPTALAPSATPVPLPVLRGLPSTRPRPDDHEHRCPGRGGKASEMSIADQELYDGIVAVSEHVYEDQEQATVALYELAHRLLDDNTRGVSAVPTWRRDQVEPELREASRSAAVTWLAGAWDVRVAKAKDRIAARATSGEVA